MSNIFTKITASVALTLLALTQVQAQSISMGTDPIYFGAGCAPSFIRNTGTNNYKISMGYYSGCVGPVFDFETIFFDVNNARIGLGVTTPSYQVHLSTNSAAKPGSSTWTILSDRRAKSDVRPYGDGLDLVRGINPVYYRYNEASGYNTDQEYVGVIAQDLQAVAPYMVHQTEVADASGQKRDFLAVDLGALDFALINSVKELDAQLQAERAANEVLREELANLRADVAALKASLSGTSGALRNPGLTISPNPASGETTLSYTLPSGAKTAQVQVVNMQGQVVNTIQVGTVDGAVTLKAHDLPVGSYILKLLVDGKPVATERLVTTH